METKGKEVFDSFMFESREAYDCAKKENEVVKQIRKKMDLDDPKVALKVYNKAVTGKIFDTVIGYSFLAELRETIIKAELATEEMLPDIPIRESKPQARDIMPDRKARNIKYKALYERQKLLNRKFKIIIAGLVILIAGFVFINLRFEYTIFTYFTNYKAKMEEELIDKYEGWSEKLQEKERQLNGENATAEAISSYDD